MKTNFKSAIAVVAMTGAMSMAPGLANAGVSIGITLPGVVYAPGYSPYAGQYYYEPIYIGGAWYHGPYRWRMENGERVFWVNGRWRHNEWRKNRYPDSITFRNGGDYRDGRYEGWGGAERFNARFHSEDGGVRDLGRDQNPGREGPNVMMRQNLRDSNGDRHDNSRDRREGQHGDAPHN